MMLNWVPKSKQTMCAILQTKWIMKLLNLDLHQLLNTTSLVLPFLLETFSINYILLIEPTKKLINI
jgi:hypothetical protein